MTYTVGYLIGSLSAESINRKFAESLVKLAPASIDFVEIPIGGLPLFNRDFESDYPASARAFKDAIADTDALLYVTPEYNRTIPGALKNAIDWASRPFGQGVLGRPSAIAGVSRGKVGTAVAQAHLRQVLGFFQSLLYSQPELYIQWTDDFVDATGEFSLHARQFLQRWMDGFEVFLDDQVGTSGRH